MFSKRKLCSTTELFRQFRGVVVWMAPLSLRSHVVTNVLDIITTARRLTNPLKMWQISNVWVGHVQNIMHEETESTVNSRNI
jgi:hypothetical protein